MIQSTLPICSIGPRSKQANTEVATLAAALVRLYSDANEGSLSVFGGFGLDPDERSDFKSFLGILQVAVLLLLLMACCNVANLLLVRASLRQREIAIRLSLGAGRRQVIRQLLVEGLLLSFLGGLLGLLVAPWGSDFILAFEQPTRGFRHIPVKVDLSVVVFTFGIVVLTGLIFGLAPAFQTRRPDLVTAMKSAGLRGGLRRSHAQKALVVSQVSISLVLLIGAGLAVRTMRKIVAVNTGFNRNNLLLMSFDLIVQGYGPERGQSFYRDLLDSAQKIPGVKSASLATVIPPAGDNVWLGHLFYPGQEPNQKEFAANWDAGLEVDVDAIGPNYFETIGTPLIAGREFNAGDDQHSPLVAVVNQKLAERLWPGENPVGKRIVRPSSEGVILPPIEIVGVAKDSKFTTLTSDAPLVFYQPLMQNYDGRATLIVRTGGQPSAFVAAVSDQVRRLDHSLPVFGIRTMNEQVDSTLWQQRTAEGMIGLLGLLALIMASVGIYGVMSHFVAQRTQEIGIRIALGARRSSILTLVLGQGILLSVAGVLIGALGGVVLARQMSSVLFGIGATDPLTYLSMTVMLLVVAGVACYVPASKAARVDPMIALRYE